MLKKTKNNEVTTKQAASMLGVSAAHLYNQKYLRKKYGFSTLYLPPKYKKGKRDYYSIHDINIVKKQMEKTVSCKNKTVSIKLNGNDIYDYGGSLVVIYQNHKKIEKMNQLIYKMPLNNTLPIAGKVFDVIAKVSDITYQCKMKFHKIEIKESMSIITLV